MFVLSSRIFGPLAIFITLALPSFAFFYLTMNIESGGYTRFSQLPLSVLNLNCFFTEAIERSSVSGILPSGQTPQKSRYLKSLIYLIVLTAISLPFFSTKKELFYWLQKASSLSISPSTASFLIWSNGNITVSFIKMCSMAGNIFQYHSPSHNFVPHFCLLHPLGNNHLNKKTQLYRFVSSWYLCEWLSSFRLQIR